MDYDHNIIEVSLTLTVINFQENLQIRDDGYAMQHKSFRLKRQRKR